MNTSEACADVLLLGVRGSFEPYLESESGMGPAVAGIAERVAALLERRGSPLRVRHEGVRYSANAWNYFRSRTHGATALGDRLARALDRCPDQRLVLVGLSQGADVIRRGLRHITPAISDRVAAVVLLGDPTRKPSDPWNHGTKDRQGGVLAWRGAPLDPRFFPRTWGYTIEGDEVAANHHRITGVFRSGSHTSYQDNRDGVLDEAAAFIIDQLVAEGVLSQIRT